ncbi:hypothetical protein EAG_09585 [Camponotus floridanus]|uniref:Uncharacterized protein n=1 Tax=Camponotus floridanus TaxID=104421 RepID=E2ARG3_CAMFO|nr:hypothetical protein EAG_09585 [Camponotus floridanus]
MLPDEMQPPKTRFNSRDRLKETHSIFSPRLKSFPAEKIKKLDNQPMFSPELNDALIVQQDNQQTGTFFANSSIKSNNGHGDVIPAILSSYQQSKSISDTDQQQIIANHQQICQSSTHSENLLNRPIVSPEKPFVSNMLQGTVVCNRSLQNPSAIINQPIIDQNHNETSALVNGCEKQPSDGRNAVNQKQIFIQPKQAAIIRNANASLSDRCVNNYQNVYHFQSHNPSVHQNSQQINEQTQHNVYHQQMLPQGLNQMQSPMFDQRQHLHNNSGAFYGHYNQQQLSATQVSGHGMTSPQDMTVNQMRSIQHNLPIHNQNRGYSINPQSHTAWPQNDRWIQTANLHQQFPQQWQYYHQDTNFNEKDSRSQDQSNSLQNYKSNQQSVAEIHTHQNRKKKLQFTPNMIRDQELLVSTMRQQGVPEEIMRRQFDALLNEQQKHLVYLMQLQQQEDIPDIKKIRLAQRRIEREEKPEWMIHITPSRISYNEIERIKAQQRGQKKQYRTDIILPQQMYVQMNPQLWQRQMIWPHKNNHQTSCNNYAACYPYHQQNTLNNINHQTNPTFNKYVPYNICYNPYYSNSEQQKISQNKEHNPSSSNSIDNQRLSMDFANFEQSKRPAEPSSLLKMRMYKEIIRPQKRNNGLQDPNTVQKVLETLKNPSSRKGLEYLANIIKKKPVIRLNGVQDSNEIPEDMQPRPPVEMSSQPQKKISVNGLENTRNPNNPTPCILRPKRADEPAMMEYPRQRQNARIYSMQAEKENGTVAINDDQQRWQPRDHIVSYVQDTSSSPYNQQNIPVMQGRHDDHKMFQYAAAPSQHYHQMQQYYLNRQNLIGHNGGQGDVVSVQRPNAPDAVRIDRAGGDTGEKSNVEGPTKRVDMQTIQRTNIYSQPEIRETRTIGGITYLARKPEYAPNNLVISPDKLIASRHLQPPRIF